MEGFDCLNLVQTDSDSGRGLGLGVKHLNCRYPIYTSCSRYKMNTNYTLPDPEERYDTSQRSYTITFRLQFLSELTVGMLSYKI